MPPSGDFMLAVEVLHPLHLNPSLFPKTNPNRFLTTRTIVLTESLAQVYTKILAQVW